MRFADAIAVEAIGPGLWRAELAKNWDIVEKTNGGYMQALAAHAASEAVGGRDPVAVTGHFTRPGHAGPVTVETEVVRNGRRYSVVTARLIQDEATILETLGSYVEPSATSSDVLLSDIPPPMIPPPDQCIRALPADDAPFPPPLMGEIDIRLDRESAGALLGKPSGKALVEGWFQLKDDEAIDPFALILASDAFPPTTFSANLPIGWTPTLELTVHIRAPRAVGWIRAQLRSHFITGGYIEEDGLFWDQDDRLVAQSRQLALVSTSQG